MASPGFDENLGLLQRVEDLSAQEFVAEPRIETLYVTIFPRRTRLDKGGPGANRGDPSPHGLGDELWAVVGADVGWNAAQDEQVGQDIDDLGRGEFFRPPARAEPGG